MKHVKKKGKEQFVEFKKWFQKHPPQCFFEITVLENLENVLKTYTMEYIFHMQACNYAQKCASTGMIWRANRISQEQIFWWSTVEGCIHDFMICYCLYILYLVWNIFRIWSIFIIASACKQLTLQRLICNSQNNFEEVPRLDVTILITWLF